ncbi:MAG TPA: hypothetical protein VGR47_19070 [Terracidiphilus sp.]|nr:hypothetical protein [Terracidiphilus sp.]
MNHPRPQRVDKLRAFAFYRLLVAVLAVALPALAGNRRVDARRSLTQDSIPAKTETTIRKTRKPTAHEKAAYWRALQLLIRRARAFDRHNRVHRSKPAHVGACVRRARRRPVPVQPKHGTGAPSQTGM